jgi:acyl carrier protein
MDAKQMQDVVDIVCSIGGLTGLRPDEDFYAAGFSSIRALQLLAELETRFDVSIPDDEFIKARNASALGGMLDRIWAATG